MLLSVALIASLGVLTFYLLQLNDANSLIEEQDRELQKQRDLIDKKETFGKAMEGLMDTALEFDGVLMTALVPFEHYESLAARAWTHRWDSFALDRDTAGVRTATGELEELLSAASAEASTNGTGTKYEAVLDELGRGFVTSLIDDADSLCESDVLACVGSDDPYTVHFDAADNAVEYMNDWLRTGVAYHEFAHVLQMTNPEPTETALASFGDDLETMADCFALTYLDGWTLDHEIWVSRNAYWEVSVGYGYTCDDSQRQVIRDWYGQLGFQARSISQ